MSERKYQMTRVRAGDYLLPSNDGQTLWRIFAYTEDGSAYWVDGSGRQRHLRGRFWGCARWRGGPGIPTEAEVHSEDFLDWENWVRWADTLDTRADALLEALSMRRAA